MNSTVLMTFNYQGDEFNVQSLVVAAQVTHLPEAYAIVTPANGVANLDGLSTSIPLRLVIKGIGSPSIGIADWFVQSICCPARPQAFPSYCMRLGVVPGQSLALKGHAADGQLMSEVLNDMGARYPGQPVIVQQMLDDDPQLRDPLLGAVLSYGESFEQFLRRMAWASDKWFYADTETKTNTNTGSKYDALRLNWTTQLRLPGVAPKEELWREARVASERFVGPTASRSFWPRSLVSKAPVAAAEVGLHTTDRITLWPTVADAYEQTFEGDSMQQAAYYLSDSIVHADAWPGMPVTDNETIVATIHVYHQAGTGEVRRLLSALVPGMSNGEYTATLADDASFGVAAVAFSGASRYSVAAGNVECLRWLDHAREIAQALGMPKIDDSTGTMSPPTSMLATVVQWEGSDSSWAAGHIKGQKRHSTEVRVCFDWSNVPVRIPFAYPMSGSEGTFFCPPSAGDRVLVHLDRLWPLVAENAFQCGDIALQGVLWHEGDMDSLSAPRGWVVKGGMVFRTAASGDLVIHAAGNLVLRAEKDIYLDGAHLHDHGRASDGSDDAAKT